MAYYLVHPDKERLIAEGFGIVANIPIIFDSNWSYQVLPSLYLRERALCDYQPRNAKTSITEMTERSNQVFGESICNFLEWCELHSKDWKKLDYTDGILKGYQAALSAGTFSAHQRGLAPSTANGRTQEACNFLDWAYIRGFRQEFRVITKTVPRDFSNPELSHGHRRELIEVRVGAVRPKPQSLHMPSKSDVNMWLESVGVEKRYTKCLMTELILRTGIRREEAVQWRTFTLPEPKDWIVKGCEIPVLIEYGTKGAKRRNERGDIVGPHRTIMVPLELAQKLHEYGETKRLKFFSIYVKSAKTSQERDARLQNKPEQLFLSDYTGRPISAQTLYDAWTEASRLPYKGWSPHLGRHYWACNELLIEAQKHFDFLSKYDRSQIPLDWIRGNVCDVITLRIQPQLGHIDKKTTERYINWAVQQYRAGDIEDAFEQALEQ